MTPESTIEANWFHPAEVSQIEKTVREELKDISLADAAIITGLGEGWQQEIHDRCVAARTNSIKRFLFTYCMTFDELLSVLNKYNREVKGGNLAK